ncbi:hypothetical protein ACUIJQ_08385 [Levilactobacillus hammesii]|uniref:DNA polymerase III beta sliding clamp C-terminal domain-containing protein n=1 Tax=Levilactobacillus hammesii DSM 16381 TaxID=1423753 RepID=A0A0R1UQT9_9LACO|nr:hypothetical protein [Levilactobacillus hammesii]KRL95543.1 hypothetical protein FD28_GL002512 [Levilactobacillus hammesii DSM 16381]
MKMNSDIEKMLKNVVKRVTDSRPPLQCVHFENGNAVVTDSHRLIKVKGVAPKDLKLDLNLADFSFPDINYPDTDRLMPKEFATKLTLTKDNVVAMLPSLKAMATEYFGKQRVVKLGISEECFKVSRTSLGAQSVQTVDFKPTDFSGEPIELSCDARYLADAFEDLTKIKDTRNRTLELKINTDLAPFLISTGNIDYLLTPVRVF